MQIIINVPTDQYIVGLINYQPNDIFQFYSAHLKSNAKQVLIKFQKESGSVECKYMKKNPNKQAILQYFKKKTFFMLYQKKAF